MKSTGSELAFIRVLRLGLGNARAVSAFVTVCKFGKKTPSRSLRSLIRRENVCANPGVLTSEFSYSRAKVCYVKNVVYYLNNVERIRSVSFPYVLHYKEYIS